MKKARILLLSAILFFFALALWLFWPLIAARLWDQKKPLAASPSSPSKEKIFEDERRKLDDLVKQKSK